MKKLILMLAVCGFGFALHADDWGTDLPKAIIQAKAEKKWVLMDFTGSDWCPPCIQLHKRVLDTPEFMKFAKTNLVLVLVDFPEKKPQSKEEAEANKTLQEKYQVDGFPTLILLDGEGNVAASKIDYIDFKAKQLIANVRKAELNPTPPAK